MELFCPDCDLKFSRQHDYATHMKGLKHAAVLEANHARMELKIKAEKKERTGAALREEMWPKVKPAFEEYLESSQSSLGQLHTENCVAVECDSLSQSIQLLYEQTRPREHIKERRKALYKFVFKLCRILLPECTLDVYGSIPHKIDDESSDIDMSVRPSKIDLPDAVVLDRVAKLVELCDCEHLNVTRILHARIPVISIRDTLTKTVEF